jgi:hypothetical protein
MALIDLNLKVDIKKADKYLRDVERDITKANVRALNKTAAKAKTIVSREIAQDIGMSIAPVKKQIKITKARPVRQVATLQATGKRVPLIKLRARQVRRGVTYSAGKGKGRKLVPGAFIASMPSGHKGVFKRRGRRRLPITELHGPSIPQVFVKGRTERLVNDLVDKEFEIIFNRELKFIQRKRR